MSKVKENSWLEKQIGKMSYIDVIILAKKLGIKNPKEHHDISKAMVTEFYNFRKIYYALILSWIDKNSNQAFSIMLVVIGMIGVLIPLLNNSVNENENSATNQLKEIENIQEGIKDLNVFLESQKLAVQNAESTIRSLSAEKNELEPIVLANREAVDNLLEYQLKRQEKFTIRNIILSFILGVLASLLANIITPDSWKKKFSNLMKPKNK